MEKYKQFFTTLLREKGWKSPAIGAAVTLVALILLDSALFTVIVGLIKLILTLSFFALLAYAAYLGYPVALEKIKQARKS
jgi:hypothetical protein